MRSSSATVIHSGNTAWRYRSDSAFQILGTASPAMTLRTRRRIISTRSRAEDFDMMPRMLSSVIVQVFIDGPVDRLGIIIIVHELGTFLTRIGVRASRSVGMGPEMAGFTDGPGTRWRIPRTARRFCGSRWKRFLSLAARPRGSREKDVRISATLSNRLLSCWQGQFPNSS